MEIASGRSGYIGGPIAALGPVGRKPLHRGLETTSREVSPPRSNGLELLSLVEDERGNAGQGELPGLAVSSRYDEQLFCENHVSNVRLNDRGRQYDRGHLSANGHAAHAGILPHMKKAPSGKAILRRIDKRLAVLRAEGEKLTDRALSLSATGSADTLRSIRRNINAGSQRGISTETIAKIAPKLKTSIEWLINESGPETVGDHHLDSADVLNEVPPSRRMVRLVGYVGAGSAAHFYALSDDDYAEVEAPEGATDQTVAVEIKGKSFGPLMDGWIVYYDDIRTPVTEDLYGEICVVGLADDRILIKQISRERDGSFTLLSNSAEPPIRNAEIEWAALVTDMKRRAR